MKAIIKIQANDKMKAGKYVDLSIIRKILEDFKICTLNEAIDFIMKNIYDDMEVNEVREVMIKHFKK